MYVGCDLPDVATAVAEVAWGCSPGNLVISIVMEGTAVHNNTCVNELHRSDMYKWKML